MRKSIVNGPFDRDRVEDLHRQHGNNVSFRSNSGRSLEYREDFDGNKGTFIDPNDGTEFTNRYSDIKAANVYESESSITEAKRVIKRRYAGDVYPAIRVYDSGKVRNRIIDFVGTKVVPDEDLQAYIDNILQEEEGSKKSNYRKWFNCNTKYFKTSVKEGKKVWKLSKLGLKVLELCSKSQTKDEVNESLIPAFDDFVILDELNESMNEFMITEGDLDIARFKGIMKSLEPKASKLLDNINYGREMDSKMGPNIFDTTDRDDKRVADMTREHLKKNGIVSKDDVHRICMYASNVKHSANLNVKNFWQVSIKYPSAQEALETLYYVDFNGDPIKESKLIEESSYLGSSSSDRAKELNVQDADAQNIRSRQTKEKAIKAFKTLRLFDDSFHFRGFDMTVKIYVPSLLKANDLEKQLERSKIKFTRIGKTKFMGFGPGGTWWGFNIEAKDLEKYAK